MWVVANVKCSEKVTFQKELKSRIHENIIFYDPKIQLDKLVKNRVKKYSKSLLENYIFCYHKNFKDKKLIYQLKNIKGLNFFLNGYNFNQEEIVSFIKRCRQFENKDGLIKPIFFNTLLVGKAKFVSGPFTNMFFELIEKQKNKMKIIIGNIVTTLPNDKNYLYQPV